MKKYLSLALILALIVAVLAGCTPAATTGGTTGAGTTAGTTKATTAGPTTTAAEETVDITLLAPDYSDPAFPFSMEIATYKKIHDVLLEKFNVNWTIEVALGEKFEETLNTRLAAAVDLPDYIKWRLSDSRMVEIYDSGLILGLNDLIDEYAPDVKKAFEEEMPYLTIANGTADGMILRIPQVVANIQHQVRTIGVRKDFCDKVGLALPETTDEFYNMLVAFQTNDVNGSGNKDEVFFPSYANMNYSLGTAFGVYGAQAASTSWWYDSDKKLYNSLLTDNAKAYVTYIAKLYGEGLIAQPFTNYTSDIWNETVYANKVAATVGAWWDGVIMAGTLSNKGIKGEHVTIKNLVQNKGDKSMNILLNLGGYNGFMITKDCDAPEKVMQIINYGYTQEGSRLDYNGEIYPGGDYYKATDESKVDPRLKGKLSAGQMEYTEKGNAEMKAEPKLWAKMGFNSGMLGQYLIGTSGDIAREFFYTFTVEACGLAADIDWNLTNLDYFIKNGVANAGFVAPTAEQTTAMNEYADLFTYMDEQIQKFMMGTRDIGEWDDFVAECESQGLAEATAIKQTLFDSYVSIMDEMGAMVFTD